MESKRGMAANVLKQDPNTWKVKKQNKKQQRSIYQKEHYLLWQNTTCELQNNTFKNNS